VPPLPHDNRRRWHQSAAPGGAIRPPYPGWQPGAPRHETFGARSVPHEAPATSRSGQGCLRLEDGPRPLNPAGSSRFARIPGR
jgi:hypothetical protein